MKNTKGNADWKEIIVIREDTKRSLDYCEEANHSVNSDGIRKLRVSGMMPDIDNLLLLNAELWRRVRELEKEVKQLKEDK